MDLTAREILDKLISFPTVSSVSNLDIVSWIEDYLASHGVESTRVYDETGTKASLYANVGPEVEGGVVLSGHTDVVPVEGQDWDTDPWTVVEKDGRLYGRGTTDMKGFDALALAAVPKALAAGIRKPIQIAFSRDEEIGLLGAYDLVREMRPALPKASAVLIGEPTGMKVVSGHKASDIIKVSVRGHEVHSSIMHEGVSAVMVAGQLVEWIRQQTQNNMAETPSEMDALFYPPFTTLHVGTIKGGTAGNITARDCEFSVDVRAVPSQEGTMWIDQLRDEAARIESEMQKINPDTYIKVDLAIVCPGVRPEENGAAEQLARQLTGDNANRTVSYGTDGGHFQQGGYSTVICGPGDIALAHQPNEFITVDQFKQGEVFLDKLINHLAS